MMLENGQQILLRYQLFAENGDLAASNLNDEQAMSIFLGRGQMLAAVEQALRQMKAGEQKTIRLDCEQAFGQTNPQLLKSTLLHRIPQEQRKVGNIIDLEDAQNNIVSARIHEIDGQTVILDFNHPLAGQQVTFDLNVEQIVDNPSP